jgi:hypothetical protein
MHKNLLTEAIEPRKFCRIWFGIDTLTPDEISDRETESGYRKSCVKVLSTVLGLQERTVRGWGRGLNFERTPYCHKLALGYALQAMQAKAGKKTLTKVA